MYHLSIESLKSQLRKGSLSESDRFRYLLAGMVLEGAMPVINAVSSRTFGWSKASMLLVLLFVASIGTYGAYAANKGPIGTDFMGRYFSLSWVVGLRFIVVIPAIGLVANFMGVKDEHAYSIISASVAILYYSRILHHMRSVNMVATSRNPDANAGSGRAVAATV